LTRSGLEAYFDEPAHRREAADLPILGKLIDRFSRERPFVGRSIVVGHILVRNSMVVVEGVARGGGDVVLAAAHPSPAEAPVLADLERLGAPVLGVPEACARGEWYLDVGAVLGRARRPRGAAEVTRTGVLHYQTIDCPVVSADDCRAKRIEGFFGTGDGFLRAWRQFHPEADPAGRSVVVFGYGKIGRGVAYELRKAGMDVTVAEAGEAAILRASGEGFAVVPAHPNPGLEAALARADVIVAVTGQPGILGRTLPADWLRRNRPDLVNLGAEDEFGPPFSDDEILGGRQIPLNFHLAQPTRNRYVDAPLAAHLLALEVLVKDPDPPAGIRPLPQAVDDWVVRTWRAAWPNEDLTGIADELGL
jgi:adenosylhomocysteinase